MTDTTDLRKTAETCRAGRRRGRTATVTEFRPEPYEPPAGRDHLVERC